MYFYIFDPKGEKETKRFERIQGQLLNLLAENRVEGETYRVTSIRTIQHLIEQAISLEAKTVVVVGSDESLNRTIGAITEKEADITTAFIPIDPDDPTAKILGISGSLETAVKALAARLTKNFDLGVVANNHFLSRVDLGDNNIVKVTPGVMGWRAARTFSKLEPFSVDLEIDDHYNLRADILAAQVVNSRSNEGCKYRLGNPTDGLLELLLLNNLSSRQIFRYRNELASGCIDNIPGTSIVPAKKIKVVAPKKLPISFGGSVITKAPATIEMAKKKVKMIVGKSRQF